MKVKLETDSYNERRYGNPWIAKVVGTEFKWGRLIGGRRGEPGRLEVEVEIGDVVATGQKDLRKPRNSAPTWGYITAGGIVWCSSEIEARDGAEAAKTGGAACES
jgi:hypothetical protein